MDKHYIIYKTTNLLNGRFYIGMHITSNLDDGYLGSGRRIKAEIKKYGRENFKRVVLEELHSKEALVQRESELVTEELREDPLCLNLKNGGEGGGRIWSEEHLKAFTAKAAIGGKVSGTKYKDAWIARGAKNLNPQAFAGMKHTEETLAKMRVAKAGQGSGTSNSQYGTCWVTNGSSTIKIRKEQLVDHLNLGFRQGRK